MRIRLAVIEALSEHARRDLPNECCGLLLGTATLIERARSAQNLRASPNRYLIDPADHFAALRAARASGWTVVGAYHSHPDGTTVPSPTDVREASYTDFLYVIVSLDRGEGSEQVSGFRLTGEALAAVPLTSVP